MGFRLVARPPRLKIGQSASGARRDWRRQARERSRKIALGAEFGRSGDRPPPLRGVPPGDRPRDRAGCARERDRQSPDGTGPRLWQHREARWAGVRGESPSRHRPRARSCETGRARDRLLERDRREEARAHALLERGALEHEQRMELHTVSGRMASTREIVSASSPSSSSGQPIMRCRPEASPSLLMLPPPCPCRREDVKRPRARSALGLKDWVPSSTVRSR